MNEESTSVVGGDTPIDTVLLSSPNRHPSMKCRMPSVDLTSEVLTGSANVALMSFWDPTASASLRGPPSLCLRKKWKMRDRAVSESRQRKKSTVCVGNLSANFITGSLKGLPSWRGKEREGGGITTVWNVKLSIRYIHTYFMWNATVTARTEGQEGRKWIPPTHTHTHTPQSLMPSPP